MYQMECLTLETAKVQRMSGPCAPWIGGCYPDDGYCGPECNPVDECAPDYECRPGNDCTPSEW